MKSPISNALAWQSLLESYFHCSFGIEGDVVNPMLQVMNRSAGRQKASMAEHEGLGWFRAAAAQQVPFC